MERKSNPARNDLKQHYLTRYCTGSAVAVYVMMRDRYCLLLQVVDWNGRANGVLV